MSLWHAQNRSRSKDTGKFRSYARIGTAQHIGKTYRSWSYEFSSHQTGFSVKRTSFSVSIADPNGNQVEYLREFTSIERADVAAREWIDGILKRMERVAISRGLGKIPTIPAEPHSQEKPTQEK